MSAPAAGADGGEAPVRRRWRSLTPEQTEVAAGILERALELRELIEDLGLIEALDIAAGEASRRRERAARERAQGPP